MDARLIRVTMAQTEDGMYRVDIMCTRNGSKLNVKDHLYYSDAVVDITKALEKWKNAKGD